MMSPKQIEEKIQRIIDAWQNLAPDKTFAGMTRAQFEARVKLSFDIRKDVAEAELKLAQLINLREDADVASLAAVQLVVNAVVGDPTEGPNSPTYEAMGYTRKSERKTGLTRKAKAPPKE
jgi:hypothetical protein